MKKCEDHGVFWLAGAYEGNIDVTCLSCGQPVRIELQEPEKLREMREQLDGWLDG